MSSKDYFDDVARRWDEMRGSFFSETVREVALASAQLAPGELAADLGAGTGFMTEALVRRRLKVIAVDQSEAMLEVLREKLSGAGEVECRVGEAERLPIPEAWVDHVFANMYLHHVERPAEAIREMARILKPGGKATITDLDEHEFRFLKDEQHDRWMGFRRDDVRRWLEEAGLSAVNVDCVGENCSATSAHGEGPASVSIFVAHAEK